MRGEFIDVGGTRLYCYAAGTRGKGDPIVLLHGFPGSSHTWGALTPMLPQGRRAIVVDLAGCGRSDPPPDSDFSVAAHGRRIGHLLQALGVSRACVVGHGYGAAVALCLAAQSPAAVSELVLISPGSPSDWPSPIGGTLEWRTLSLPGVATDWSARLVAMSIKRCYLDEARGLHSAEQFLLPYTNGGYGVFRAQALALGRDRSEGVPDLTRVTARSTVIWGDLDAITSHEDALQLVRTLPHATLEVLPGSGFCLPEETPEHLAALLSRLLFT